MGESEACDFEIHFSELSGQHFMEFEIRVSGIALSDELKNKIDKVNYGDIEILNTSEYANLYSAVNTVLKLNGKLHFAIHSDNEVFVHILIPKSVNTLKAE